MILLFSFIGEFFRMVIPLPVPASVYGLVLLLAALLTGVIKLDQVEGDVYKRQTKEVRLCWK